MTLRLALVQLNCVVGDLPGNRKKLLRAAQQAAAQGAHVVLTPELSLTGYPPEDLLLRTAFYQACAQELAALATELAELEVHVVVGYPAQNPQGKAFNAAAVLYRGQIVAQYHKHDLPNYTVFDEQRYFTPDNRPCVFECQGVRLGLNICEDTWFAYAPECAKAAGAEVLLVLNASPYHMGKQTTRLDVLRQRIQETNLPICYANLVGGQDELVFDGASVALNAQGDCVAQAPSFAEDMVFVDYADGKLQAISNAVAEPAPSLEAEVYAALVMGVRDYVQKNGFPGVLLGLSGGVDSALVLCVAVDALGPDKVRAVMMPSPYTAEISWLDSRALVENLGVRYDEVSIQPCFDAFLHTLADEFKGLKADTTEENLQARIRGTLLMALSNKYGSIVLTTGNKSEMATGYCTLYGDMAGGFAVIKDVLKTMVYRLCAYRNTLRPDIPERILTRAPSAELRPDQTDQDSLPPYEVLDDIIRRYMEQDEPVVDIIASGHAAEVVNKVVRLIKLNEYKRRQAPVGIRVTERGFGRDWRYPITNKFRE
ncbi:NAD+ synthase [Parvibium lacunae]|uniref:Glutamine-dependent NAD(+) synthetase n=1 Tax=Parvibium lacunae TaxID=1888893 RepID=A0A368L3K7_9BURK|nr:NAD+ synthase [Parvibium lacunae]RCS58144.1 NAD+ synthase [Parvibium lacunae]